MDEQFGTGTLCRYKIAQYTHALSRFHVRDERKSIVLQLLNNTHQDELGESILQFEDQLLQLEPTGTVHSTRTSKERLQTCINHDNLLGFLFELDACTHQLDVQECGMTLLYEWTRPKQQPLLQQSYCQHRLRALVRANGMEPLIQFLQKHPKASVRTQQYAVKLLIAILFVSSNTSRPSSVNDSHVDFRTGQTVVTHNNNNNNNNHYHQVNDNTKNHDYHNALFGVCPLQPKHKDMVVNLAIVQLWLRAGVPQLLMQVVETNRLGVTNTTTTTTTTTTANDDVCEYDETARYEQSLAKSQLLFVCKELSNVTNKETTQPSHTTTTSSCSSSNNPSIQKDLQLRKRILLVRSCLASLLQDTSITTDTLGGFLRM